MSDLLTFIVLALAAYRVTRLVTTDSILDRPRNWWFLHFPPNRFYRRHRRMIWADGAEAWAEAGTWFPIVLRKMKANGGHRVSWQLNSAPVRPAHKLGQLVECPWCIGFWISGAVVWAATAYTSVPMPLAWWWAVSSAVGATAKTVALVEAYLSRADG